MGGKEEVKWIIMIIGVGSYYPNSKFNKKYKDGVSKTDVVPIIKYSDVALNMAEACARIGAVATGLED